MIHLQNLHLTLTGGGGAVEILKEIDLHIAPGETVSLVGPSGAGKTSLLMLISGLERPTSGEIEVDGNRLNDMTEDDLARFRQRQLGIVFQGFHLVPTMTAEENVALPLEFAGDPEARNQARSALETVGLADRCRHYPGQLSGGEQQRVALARAFVSRPPLLLADEPTGNLDAVTGQKIIDQLFNLQQSHNTTLLLVTHDKGLARRCDRQLQMTDGRLLTESRS